MVKLPKIRKQKDKGADEFQKGMALTETGRQSFTPEFVESLGRSVYMIYDEEVIKLLEDHDLLHLVPALSHLNRVTSQTKKETQLDMLDLEAIFLMEHILMEEGEYEDKTSKLLGTLEYFANHIPTDAYDGFKAKLLAYQMKVLETRVEEKKKRGII